jgi:hypothetical protein
MWYTIYVLAVYPLLIGGLSTIAMADRGQPRKEEFVPMVVAAGRLGLDKSTISRIVKRKNIPTRRHRRDARYRLVDYTQLRELYEDYELTEE